MKALKQYAQDVGVDVLAFAACLESSKYHQRVQGGIDEGTALGVESTPTVFVNGRVINGSQSYETFAALVDDELERQAAR